MLLHKEAVQEGHHLRTSADFVGAEGVAVAGAKRDAVLNGPLDRFGVIGICTDIGKGDGAACSLASCHAAEERSHLRTGAIRFGAERGFGGTVGNARFHGPQNESGNSQTLPPDLWSLLRGHSVDHLRSTDRASPSFHRSRRHF